MRRRHNTLHTFAAYECAHFALHEETSYFWSAIAICSSFNYVIMMTMMLVLRDDMMLFSDKARSAL